MANSQGTQFIYDTFGWVLWTTLRQQHFPEYFYTDIKKKQLKLEEKSCIHETTQLLKVCGWYQQYKKKYIYIYIFIYFLKYSGFFVWNMIPRVEGTFEQT